MKVQEKTVRAVKLLLNERGYVVIGIKPGSDARMKVGEITHIVCAYEMPQPFCVVSKTDYHDWLEQCRLVAKHFDRMNPYSITDAHKGEAFYRVTTD